MTLNLKKLFSSGGGVQYILVGLGNPGKQYENTRHNAGYLALDYIAKDMAVTPNRLKFSGLCTEATLAGKRVLLLKPTTFMNNSGQAVVAAMQFYKLPPERVVILFDDISIEVGSLRIRRKGSHGGQKGMKSIIELTGSDDFTRIKIGIGAKPHADFDLADWVLSKFSPQDSKQLDTVFANALQAAKLIVDEKTDTAMNQFN